MRYPFVVFDLDGTLIDSLPSITGHLNRTLKAHGFRALPEARVRELVGNSSRYLVERALLETPGRACSPEKQWTILNEYNDAYRKEPILGTRVYPGVMELLRELLASGHSCAILSNKPEEIVRPIAAHFFSEIAFWQVRGYRSEIPRKPDPAGLWSLIEARGVSVAQTAYVGDSEVDALLGKAAGTDTFLVQYGFRTKFELSGLFCRGRIDRPQELLSYLM